MSYFLKTLSCSSFSGMIESVASSEFYMPVPISSCAVICNKELLMPFYLFGCLNGQLFVYSAPDTLFKTFSQHSANGMVV